MRMKPYLFILVFFFSFSCDGESSDSDDVSGDADSDSDSDSDSDTDSDGDSDTDSDSDVDSDTDSDTDADTDSDSDGDTDTDCGNESPIDIQSGIAPTIDGHIAADEWSDACTLEIEVNSDWTVTVYYKHDASNLYIAFTNLVNEQERYPEVLIDANHDGTTSWEPDDWWFHASYQECEGEGMPNDYFPCTASGWEANTFPLAEGIVEFRISYAKIGLEPSSSEVIGIAFDVTDTWDEWQFWPQSADLHDPSTWGDGISSDDWM